MENHLVLSILNAPEHQLRALLKLLLTCGDAKVQSKVKELYTDITKLDQPASDEHGNKRKVGDEDAVEKLLKRAKLANDIHICDHCEGSFLESANSHDACQYHPGRCSTSDENITLHLLIYSTLRGDGDERRGQYMG